MDEGVETAPVVVSDDVFRTNGLADSFQQPTGGTVEEQQEVGGPGLGAESLQHRSGYVSELDQRTIDACALGLANDGTLSIRHVGPEPDEIRTVRFLSCPNRFDLQERFDVLLTVDHLGVTEMTQKLTCPSFLFVHVTLLTVEASDSIA